MKNILLATTALVMTAGAASAEITWSGTAAAGIAREGATQYVAADATAATAALKVTSNALEVSTLATLTAARIAYNADSTTEKATALATAQTAYDAAVAADAVLDTTIAGVAKGSNGDVETYTEVALTAKASVTTDSGLTLGTSVSVDSGAGYDLADDDGFDSAKTNGVGLDNVTISGAMGTLTIDGNNNGTTGGDLAMLVDADDETGDIAYTGTFGEMTLNVVADTSKDPKTNADVAWSAAVSGSISGIALRLAGDEESAYAASAGYSIGGVSVTLATKKEAAAVNDSTKDATNSIALGYTMSNGLGLTYGANSDNDGNDYSYGVSYTVDGMALAYSSDEAESWTASISYDLGAGASAIAQQNYTGDMQIGVSMSF